MSDRIARARPVSTSTSQKESNATGGSGEGEQGMGMFQQLFGQTMTSSSLEKAWSVAQILFPEQIQRAKITRETMNIPPYNRVILVEIALGIWDDYYKKTLADLATKMMISVVATEPLLNFIFQQTNLKLGDLSQQFQFAPVQFSMLTMTIGPYFENNLPFPSSEQEKLKELLKNS